MAKTQILWWAKIPVGVRARDADGDTREHLPERFQHAVDHVATATGRTGTTEYLAQWNWGPWEERAGAAKATALALVAELDESYPSQRVAALKAELTEEFGRVEKIQKSRRAKLNAVAETEDATQ